MISSISGNLLFRRDGYLIRILNEERSPPTERTVGDDGVLAVRHKLHVTEAFLSLIPIHEIYFVFRKVEIENLGILLTPFHAPRVAEKYEHRIIHHLLDMTDGSLEITVLIAITIASEHIATSGMDGNCIATIKESCHFLVLRVIELRKSESLPYFLLYPLHTAPDSFQRKPLTCEHAVIPFIENILILTVASDEILLADCAIGALEPVPQWRVY